MHLMQCLWFAGLLAVGQSAASQPAAEADRFEREVMDNLLAQPVGPGTVADLNLPEAFRRRVADRALRASYEQQFRIVVPDNPVSGLIHTGPLTTPAIPTPPGPAPKPSGRVVWGSGGLIAILLIAVALKRRRRLKP